MTLVLALKKISIKRKLNEYLTCNWCFVQCVKCCWVILLYRNSSHLTFLLQNPQTCVTTMRPPPLCATMAPAWWRLALLEMMLPGLCSPLLLVAPVTRYARAINFTKKGNSFLLFFFLRALQCILDLVLYRVIAVWNAWTHITTN